MFFVWCDRFILASLCLLIFVLPASIAGVEIFSWLAIVFLIVKKAGALITAFRGSAGKARREVLDRAIRTPFPVRSVYLSVAGFLVMSYVSIFVSWYPSLSVHAFLGKTLPTVLLFFAVQEVLTTEKRVRWFVRIFLASATILCLDGFWQFMAGRDIFKHLSLWDGRIRASLHHPNGLGAYLIPVASLAAWSVVDVWGRFRRDGWLVMKTAGAWGTIILAVVVLTTMGMTFSRGAWLGLAVALACLALMKRETRVPLLLTGLSFFLIFVPLLLQSRGYSFFSFPVFGSSAGKGLPLLDSTGRIAYWEDAFRIIQDHPVWGTGLNTYTLVIKEYASFYRNYAHNCYLQITAETGIAGLAVFLWIIGSIVVFVKERLNKISRELSGVWVALFAGWIGFLAECAVDTTLYSKQLGVLFWLLTSLCVVYPFAVSRKQGATSA